MGSGMSDGSRFRRRACGRVRRDRRQGRACEVGSEARHFDCPATRPSAVGELRESIRKQPAITNSPQRKVRYQALDDLATLKQVSGSLARNLKAGMGREETYPTFQRIQTIGVTCRSTDVRPISRSIHSIATRRPRISFVSSRPTTRRRRRKSKEPPNRRGRRLQRRLLLPRPLPLTKLAGIASAEVTRVLYWPDAGVAVWRAEDPVLVRVRE